MFMGFCVVVLLALVPLLRGDLRRLSHLRVRLSWLIFLALVVQVIVISLTPGGNHTAQATGHILSYVAALTVIVANRHVPGVLLIGAGTFANGLAIALNGGTLPASAAAQRESQLHKIGAGLDNSAPLAHPHLGWLGDQYVTPAFLPLRNVMSIGDLLILAGALVLVWVVTGARLAPSPSRG